MTRALFHAERLAGTCEAVQSFFRWWSAHGPFALTVPKYGGLRADEATQEMLFINHKSKARTLKQTPHGRGAAADAYPAVVVGGVVQGILLPESSAEALAMFRTYGGLAESHGLEWGGRWLVDFPPNGDMPHIQCADWRKMSYPPRFS